jgi:hypothetical protein
MSLSFRRGRRKQHAARALPKPHRIRTVILRGMSEPNVVARKRDPPRMAPTCEGARFCVPDAAVTAATEAVALQSRIESSFQKLLD